MRAAPDYNNVCAKPDFYESLCKVVQVGHYWVFPAPNVPSKPPSPEVFEVTFPVRFEKAPTVSLYVLAHGSETLANPSDISQVTEVTCSGFKASVAVRNGRPLQRQNILLIWKASS